MSKEYQYRIYHVERERLMALEREGRNNNLGEQNCEVVRQYIILTSNRPRRDSTVSKCFKLGTKTIDEMAEEIDFDEHKLLQDKMKAKVSAAKFLVNAGFYKEVGRVAADTADEACLMTMSVHQEWYLKKNANVLPLQGAWRDTASLDVVAWFDEFFLKMPLGYLSFERGMYAEELV